MPEALPLQPGDPQRIGSYEITGRLGVGEQGAVFLGRDPAGGHVAVKVLHVRLSGEPVARSRFTGAFTSARKVSGFCTAAILHADVEGDRPYVVSEWVDGPSLQQLVDEEGPRGGAVVERLAVGMAIALAAVHRAGALHHDLKPGNVLLGRDGPRLSDFGIAHALEAVNVAFSGHITEDPSYKSPEQLSGRDIGPAADVFAWASTIVFAATGRPPFGTGSSSETMHRIVYDEPDLTAVPDSIRDVVADAFIKDPANRPTARDLLRRFLDGNSALASRMPSTMVAEGRALASGVPAQLPGPPPGPHGDPQPGPPAGPPTPPVPAPAPRITHSLPPPSPGGGQPPPAPPVPAAPIPGMPGPGMASPGIPGGPALSALPAPSAEKRSPTPSLPLPLPLPLPLLGKLSRVRRSRTAGASAKPAERAPAQSIAADPTAADPTAADPIAAHLDPSAFEETATFDAFAPRQPDRSDQTMKLDAVGLDPTATFDAIDLDDQANTTEPAPLIPGLAEGPGLGGGPGGQEGGRSGSSPLAALSRIRRPSNHVLGVALSLFIGVGVGIAIITLVLWPQLKADDGPPPESANASNNRPVTAIPSSFGGTWKGTLVNTSRNASFPVKVTFDVGGTTGQAVYPREGCTGTLTLTRGTESALKMSLAINKPCTPGVVQVTRQPDGTLQYTWSRPGTKLSYGGRLVRG